jgi:hypothetical protein
VSPNSDCRNISVTSFSRFVFTDWIPKFTASYSILRRKNWKGKKAW